MNPQNYRVSFDLSIIILHAYLCCLGTPKCFTLPPRTLQLALALLSDPLANHEAAPNQGVFRGRCFPLGDFLLSSSPMSVVSRPLLHHPCTRLPPLLYGTVSRPSRDVLGTQASLPDAWPTRSWEWNE